MAENQGVWGIEIGQAGLKAIRLRYAEAASQVLAVAFDYVPHPKILSQPDAVPEQLIREALAKFLSRNELKGDKVVISVPGQTALARFIQLPPVPAPKVPEIVKFEARQQIPFALEDVIWDYQVLSVGMEESDFLLDAEVGLFAMKRDQVQFQLNPFLAAKVEVDQIQIAPLGLYNVLYYDQMGMRVDDEEQKKDEHYIILDMGADNTTLVVTNGAKIWIRNVPVGGNHFTRALTKEMKLTFAKAEHLKCNATKSPDPRAVFKALQPVFNDYVSEIQRSIGYFSSVNRNAKIKKLVGVGNGFKLAGLQKFLQQNLTQFEVERLSGYKGLVGDNVLNASLFEENLLTFAVPYGLALQGLKLTKIHTSLLPPEIVTARKIRQKKPWATAAAAAMLLGLSVSAFGYARVQDSVSTARFGEAETQVADFTTKVGGFKTSYEGGKTEHDEIVATGRVLIDQLNARENWLEVYRAINEALPRDKGDIDEEQIELRNRIKLPVINVEKSEDLLKWYTSLERPPVDSMIEYDRKPPVGPGYVFTLQGVHYHHEPDNPETGQGGPYVTHTLLKNLQDWKSPGGRPIRALGITHAALIASPSRPARVLYYPDIRRQQMMGNGAIGGINGNEPMPMEAATEEGGEQPTDPSKSGGREIHKTVFVLQFVWQPVPKAERQVNDIAFELLSKDPATPFDQVQAKVSELNKGIAEENALILENNASLPEGDPSRSLTRELAAATQEQFDAFKKRFFEKGTPETLPQSIKAASAGGEGGADGMMDAAH